MNVSLSIAGTLADLYAGEEITLNRKLKDLQDLGKTMTDFSRPFTLPATDVNNGIFEHFYNLDINDPFPVHEKVDATLTINGIDVFVGVLELTSVTLKDLTPDNYAVTFYGRNKQLTTLWGEDTLRDIDINLDHALTNGNVKDSWAGNLRSGNVVYPVIDYGARDDGPFKYSPSAIYPTQNIARGSGAITATELRPAMKFNLLLEKCFTHIGKTLAIDTQIADPNLYVLGMNNAGPMMLDEDPTFTATKDSFSSSGSVNAKVKIENYDSKTDPSSLFDLLNGEYTPRAVGQYTFQLTINSPSTQRVIIRLRTDSTPIKAQLFGGVLSGTKRTFTATLNSAYYAPDIYAEITFLANTTGDTTYSFTSGSMTLTCVAGPQIPYDPDILLEETMPDMKISKFVGDVLAMYNAVLLTTDGTNYTMQNITEYFDDGSALDYTDKVHTETLIIEKKDIPERVVLKHQEIEDVANEEFENVLRRRFGELVYDNAGKYDFTSDEKVVETPFAIFPPTFQQVVDANGKMTGLSDLELPSFLDASGQPLEVPLSLWYFTGTETITDTWYFDEGSGTSSPTAQTSFPFFRPFSQRPATSSSYSLGYTYETDYDGAVATNTLFEEYWQHHLDALYNAKMRRLMVTAVLEASDWLNLQMNDTIKIAGRGYKIESISYNLTSKFAKLSLFTYVPLNRPTPIFGSYGKVTFSGGTPTPQDRKLTNTQYVNGSYVRKVLTPYQMQQRTLRTLAQLENVMYLIAPRLMDMEITSTNSTTLENTNYYTIDSYDTSAFNDCPDFTQSQANGQFTLEDTFLTDVVFTASFADDTNKALQFTIFVNGSATNFNAYESAGATEVNLVGVLDLQEDDVVDIRVRKTDSGNFTLELEAAEFIIRRAR